MATAKVLQTPSIIEIIGSTIRVAHPDIKRNTSSYLSSPLAAAGTAMTLFDNNGFKDDDWFILGAIGDPETEENDVNGTVTRGETMTVTNTLKFDHELNAPITKIFERGIKIYGAATDGGSGTLIASIDAISSPIADAFNIQWNKQYTEYTLLSTDTTYAYYYVKFTDGTTDSAASAYVVASGVTYNSISPLIQRALDITDSELDDKELTGPMMVNWAQDCQEAITQFMYQDPQSGKFMQKDWDFEAIEDVTSIVTSENENKYAFSLVTSTMKYPNSDKGIIGVRIGTALPLNKISIDEYDEMMVNKPRTDLTVQATAGDTSITVTSTADFDASGTLLLGTEVLTYTAKTSTTFTGIPASGTGSITATHAVGSPVWQNITAGSPSCYAQYNGYIYFDVPVDSTTAGRAVKIRYLKRLTRLTALSDATVIPFTNVFPLFIAAKIEQRKQNPDKATAWMTDFTKQVTANAQASYVPVADTFSYYNYPGELDAWDNVWG